MTTAYKAKVFDRIESNAAYTMHENELIDINQEGLESELLLTKTIKNWVIYKFFKK